MKIKHGARLSVIAEAKRSAAGSKSGVIHSKGVRDKVVQRRECELLEN